MLLPAHHRPSGIATASGISGLDSDGDTRVLIPLFIEMGVTVHWPLERAWHGTRSKCAASMDMRSPVWPVASTNELIDFAAIDAELNRIAPLIEDGGYIDQSRCAARYPIRELAVLS